MTSETEQRPEPAPFRLDAERVGEPLASILVSLGLHGVAVPEVTLPACVSVHAGPLNLDDLRADVAVEKRELKLTIPGLFGPDTEKVWNKAGALRLEDGSRIEARFTNFRSDSFSGRIGEPAQVATTFDLMIWTWTTSRAAVAWLGRLPRLKFSQHNLGLWDRSRRSSSRNGLRLRGHYTWYILGDGRKGDPILVLDSGSDVPKQEHLRADFSALEFVLGCPTALDLLVGVDTGLQPVAALGPHMGFRERQGEETWPPIPDALTRKTWAPCLFPKIATKLATPNERVFVAVAGYMDSLVDHLDGAYLKAQVALEAFCKSIGSRKTRVKNSNDWNDWLISVESKIRSMAVDKDAGDALVGAVRSAMHPASSSVVPSALEQLGMTVPKEVLAELKGRNIPVHDFVMSRRDEDPILESLPRLRTVQALLGAVAARAVGYSGPVLGWKQDTFGQREELGWWDVADEPEASKVYVAERLDPNG